jgi:hypothetical protein
MQGLKKGCAVLSLLALGGCFSSAGEGRIVGFAVDGQTGQRLNFFVADESKQNIDDDSDSKAQIYAVIGGEFHRATPCGSGDLSQENGIHADGCFQIDGIPAGMEIPIFAEMPNFERFVGRYSYPLHDEDVKGSQKVVNLRLFPVGFAVDYRFQVNFEGRPVAGANVVCQYRQQAGNSLQVDGIFLTPENSGSTSITVQTDATGMALLPGAQLVNGARYHCEAALTQPVDGRVLSGSQEITAGVDQAEQGMSLVSTGAVSSSLYAVNSNGDNPAELLGANGKLVINFNRPVELMARTADCQVASLFTTDFDTDTRTGSLVTDIPGNNASENMTAELSGDGLSLTLGFRTQNPLDADDRGTSVQFSGIYVRPRNATDGTQVRFIGGGCPQGEVYGGGSALQNIRTGGTQTAFIRLF